MIEFLGITLLGALIYGLIKMAIADVKDALDDHYDSMGDDE